LHNFPESPKRSVDAATGSLAAGRGAGIDDAKPDAFPAANTAGTVDFHRPG
jgi:hypothetical protein